MTVTHPLDRLTADEITATRAVLTDGGLFTEAVRVVDLALEEPTKADVLAFTAGDAVERRIRATLLDTATGVASVVLASLTAGKVESVTELDAKVDGQPPIMLDEFVAVDEIVKADAGWQAALEKRGITDLSLVAACPLSAGAFDLPGEEGKRLLRVLSFRQDHPADHPWAHPVDGLVAYVDLIAREVVELVDIASPPIPAEAGNFDDPAFTGPARTSLKTIEITQPDGPSFTVDGDHVTWEGWTFRVGFDAREGLVLHQLGLQGRSVVHRASVAEMVVPYGDPSRARFWQNYFDTGEYLLGQQVNSLSLGCDCLGHIHYFDAVLADSACEPRTVSNAICMHEEDYGVLWKHTDLFTGSQETRRQRRLVISSFVTVGNYDYGFYWYLYLDGTIELEAKLTGVPFTSAYVGDDTYSTEVAPGLGAPIHQHFFCARLDMAVDGVANAVDEVDFRRIPVGEGNEYGNAFGHVATRIASEAEGARVADGTVGRVWRVSSAERTNRLGRPTAYVLRTEAQPTLLADPTSSIAKRAAFATKNLWVTRYDPQERFPAGEFVNQHPGGAGLPTWVAADRALDGEDVVLWHTFGVTHLPRVEDWPIMPVDTCRFVLRPEGFFDRNPTLDVPASSKESTGSCHAGG